MRKMKLYMDTVVDIHVVTENAEAAELKVEQAFEAFRKVEEACSRFSPNSELMLASRVIQRPVQVSPFLFEPLKFALEMAKQTDGLFDPTVGKAMEDLGFNRHYLTGELIHSNADRTGSYMDIILDDKARTMFLKKPLLIDLGAVAKGFAIDLAANELKDFDGFIINAGGDLFAGGRDKRENKWKIGIQHPYEKERIIDTVEISNAALCTSGSYERKSKETQGMHHLINPKTIKSPNKLVSASIIAPYAMMADAFSTVSFLLGTDSIELIQNKGLMGILITPDLQIKRVGGGN